MKTSTPTQSKPMVPPLFQIASHFEDFVPASGLKKPVPALSQTPFADLMSHPEKLEAALKAARAENDAFAASRTFRGKAATSTTRNPPPNNRVIKTHKAHMPRELKKIEFCLEAPTARPVNSDALQKFLQLNFQAFRCVVTIGLAVLFIMAWILTSPFLRLGAYLSDLCRLNSTSSNQINKGNL